MLVALCVGPTWSGAWPAGLFYLSISLQRKLSEVFYSFLSSQMTEDTRLEAPKFDGASTAFANYGEKVSIWKKIATLGPANRAAHLLSHMSDVARKVCALAGRDVVRK